MAQSQNHRLLQLAKAQNILTAREIRKAGIHSQEITRALASGELNRIARGQYQWSEQTPSAHESLILASNAMPQAVGCLLTALSFHGIGSQLPADLWLALPRDSAQPAKKKYPPMQIVRFSPESYAHGIGV